MKGYKKIEQRLQDLERNEEFLELVNGARRTPEPEERSALLLEACSLFGVDWEMFNYIRENGSTDLRSLFGKVDICVIGYSTEDDLFGSSLHTESEKKLHRLAYPSTIDIHRFATKTDVINFIEENWESIQRWRNFVNGPGEPPRFRDRKNAELSEFAYDRRDMDRKELKLLIKNTFKKTLGYQDLNTLIADEKNRRNKSLKV